MRNGPAWWTTRRRGFFSDARGACRVRGKWCFRVFFNSWMKLSGDYALNRKLSIWTTTLRFWVILLMDKSCTSVAGPKTSPIFYASPIGTHQKVSRIHQGYGREANFPFLITTSRALTKQIHPRMMMVPDFHGWFLVQSWIKIDGQKILSLIKDLTSKFSWTSWDLPWFHDSYPTCLSSYI